MPYCKLLLIARHSPAIHLFTHSQSGLSKQQDPVALFEFSFSSDPLAVNGSNGNGSSPSNNGNGSSPMGAASNCVSGASTIGGGHSTGRPADGDNKTTLCMEYSHQELYSFFDQLERIQHQLDALT